MMNKNGAGNEAANDSAHAPEPLSPMRSTTHQRNASQETTTAKPKQSYVQVADTMFPRFKPDENTAAAPQAKQTGRRECLSRSTLLESQSGRLDDQLS
jgi:hypothetical protein